MKVMTKLGLIIAVANIVSLINPAMAQILSRPLPANASPGIVEIQKNNNRVFFISYEIDSIDIITNISDLPLSEIKGDREKAYTNQIGCYPAAKRTTCLVDLFADGNREIWFYKQGSDAAGQTLIRLHDRVVDEYFWSAFRTTIANDGLLVYATFPTGTAPAAVYLERANGDLPFYSYELSDPLQPVVLRPSFNGDTLTGLALVLAPTGERFPAPAEAIEILAANGSGVFVKYAPPSDCEVLGAINDTLVCGQNTRGREHISNLPQYGSVMRLTPPEGVTEDTIRDLGSPAFQTIDNSVLFRAMEAGVMRPYLQALSDNVATPALANAGGCIDANEHVDVFEVSVERTVALVTIFGPLSPRRFVLAPIIDNRIHPCAPSTQTFSHQIVSPQDVSGFSVKRTHLGAATKVPTTLISGPSNGPLSGHIMIASYATFGLAMSEEYLGPWLAHWVANGGKFAYVHLPGGGGFGAEWARRGFGIKGKIKTSALFDEVTAAMVAEGLADHGKVSIMTESGGGPLAAHSILHKPERYAVFALRAGCLAFEGDRRSACTRSHDYGNWSDPEDRNLMQSFDPLERILDRNDFPQIVLGTPEFDDRVSLDYQERMARKLAPRGAKTFRFQGLNHSKRGSPELEARWVQQIAATALNSVIEKDPQNVR
ncbi:MAG: prolyl oligopeptidase family serine peptidase [Pseudomonadota bacterium]